MYNFKKKIGCDDCKKAFLSSSENLIEGSEETTAVKMKNKGGLIHPNINLFQICLDIEKTFKAFIDSKQLQNIYCNTIRNMSHSHLSFPCDSQKEFMVACLTT